MCVCVCVPQCMHVTTSPVPPLTCPPPPLAPPLPQHLVPFYQRFKAQHSRKDDFDIVYVSAGELVDGAC